MDQIIASGYNTKELLDVNFKSVLCANVDTVGSINCGEDLTINGSLHLSHKKCGKAYLNNGYCEVNLVALTSNSNIFLTNNDPKGPIWPKGPIAPYVAIPNVKAGTFSIVSDHGDFSGISWFVIDN